MKKRLMAAALACAMLCGLLAGCGGGGEPMADAEAAMDGGARLDTGGGSGHVGGSEDTNDALDDLIGLQGEEMEGAGNGNDYDGRSGAVTDGSIGTTAGTEPAGDAATVAAPVVSDVADPVRNQAEQVAYVAPLMPDEIENTGTSGVKATDLVDATPAEEVPAPVAMPAESTENIQEQMVALAASTYQTYLPTASTTNVRAANNYGWVDYGNAADGYIVVCYTAQTSTRLKCLVKGPSGTQYTYNLAQGAVTTLPLSDGSGTYTVGLYENVTGSKYAKNLSQEIQVSLKNEFGPFLYSNQYVDYMSAPNTRATGADLCGRAPDLIGKVDQVYSWVVNNISYDYNKAKTVQSGYLPVLDTVLANRTGICFDYAALMAGMLRSQGIPCKLVVGYAGTAYHAWISVWSDEQGWIEGVIYFDGTTWQRMDPTFASSGNQSSSIMQYIGNGANYQEKYLY